MGRSERHQGERDRLQQEVGVSSFVAGQHRRHIWSELLLLFTPPSRTGFAEERWGSRPDSHTRAHRGLNHLCILTTSPNSWLLLSCLAIPAPPCGS